MAHRPVADRGLGLLPACLRRHAAAAAGAAYLRRQLVHAGDDHYDSRAAPDQQRRRSRCRCSPPRATRSIPACRTRWCSGGYGHNAVGFFLTAGFLGMMYYFIPKAANRPVYSYRLSIVHFWTLIFLYIWAGPHHFALYRAAGLDADPWHGVFHHAVDAVLGRMINGIMTLSGAWDKLRTDPGLRFSVTAVGFYGMSTFEGPVMSGPHGQCAVALHRLDNRPRAFRRAGLGRVHHLRRDVLPRTRTVAPQGVVFREACGLALLRSPPWASCSTSSRCGSPGSWKA